MRLSELFEDSTAVADQQFNMAWQNMKNSIPQEYHGKVQSTARDYMVRGESPSDALSLARTSVLPANITTQSNTQITTKPKPKTAKDISRVSKSGKRWGNQHYSDPSQAGGIRGALHKSSPQNLVRKTAANVSKEVGDLLDIEKAFNSGKSKR